MSVTSGRPSFFKPREGTMKINSRVVMSKEEEWDHRQALRVSAFHLGYEAMIKHIEEEKERIYDEDQHNVVR